MGSDGGLVDRNNFSGLKSALSGPAGGAFGYALTIGTEKRNNLLFNLLGLAKLLFGDRHVIPEKQFRVFTELCKALYVHS